ncbi:lysozyme-like domain-containing protein [Syncephalis pseudoplumigaleata]|uniref:Lysozyme-like domain-containing protein n=1 Tax=Syncephalis pseudoplumigaleata TaxID=1712513 RepID=A0A4P9YWX2_9FUNG|nr:lysozyme-like domain-containing protein [Syncephalis pseudoplumigaleata]|eukprot:RKP24546.1 lysozyme-like domain-containing protein [Syncephalis pseudoplumigaleata]
MARRITSTFENGDDQPHYEYIENLDDQRGYTAGVVGFTTGTGDLLKVVEAYTRERPNNVLAPFLPELRRLAALSQCDVAGRSDVQGLAGLPDAWREAARNDALFRDVQARMAQDFYLRPALQYAGRVGVRSPLGVAIFYDTIVQHGWHRTESEVNMPRLLSLTERHRNSTSGEAGYLGVLLHIRRRMLCCYPDNTWPESAGRVADLQALLQAGNFNLSPPITLAAFGVTLEPVDDDRLYVQR